MKTDQYHLPVLLSGYDYYYYTECQSILTKINIHYLTILYITSFINCHLYMYPTCILYVYFLSCSLILIKKLPNTGVCIYSAEEN